MPVTQGVDRQHGGVVRKRCEPRHSAMDRTTNDDKSSRRHQTSTGAGSLTDDDDDDDDCPSCSYSSEHEQRCDCDHVLQDRAVTQTLPVG